MRFLPFLVSRLFFLSILFVLLSLPTFPLFAQEGSLRIQSIELRGNQHIESSAIRSRMTLNVGDSFNTEVVRQQIQHIYEMGYFEDVRVQTESEHQGMKVVFVLKEKPFNAEVAFDGNDHFSEDKLKEKITVRSQVFLDLEQVKTSTENIRKAYQDDGYYNSDVVPVVQTIGENRTRVTFFIKEGSRARIKTVTFKGRRVVRKKDLMKSMATREWIPLWSMITDAGILKKNEIPNDIERIKEVYMNKGYLDVQVGQPTIDLDKTKKWFTVTFPIVEGEPYLVSRVRFQNYTVFTEKELRAGLSIHSDDVFQRSRVRMEVTRLKDLYGKKGYAFTEVTPAILPDSATRTTEVDFKIDAGDLIQIRGIHIAGNAKTRDNVIRRELRLDEGDMIDSVAIKRSFQRLNNLNFFKTVEVVPEQINKRQVDLNVKVKEKPTGSFSVGGGFSTLDKLNAIANITEGNLFGRGYLARIQGQLGARRTLGIITFRNPAIFDSLTSFQTDVFSNRTNFITFNQKRTGATMTVGRQLTEYVIGSFAIVGEAIDIKFIRSDASPILHRQLGKQSTTGVRFSLVRDTRDVIIDPRTGTRVAARGSLGTDVLGGSNDFVSLSLDALKFTPFPFWDLRHMIRARLGVGQGFNGQPLPLTEFFFVGGIQTLRGFKFGRAGPVTPNGTLEGGNKQLIFNNDLIFPVLPEAKLNGVLFFDYGKGFREGKGLSLNLRAAAGIEIRWLSPFGPLRAAWGKNLSPKGREKSSVFEFSVGNLF